MKSICDLWGWGIVHWEFKGGRFIDYIMTESLVKRVSSFPK